VSAPGDEVARGGHTARICGGLTGARL